VCSIPGFLLTGDVRDHTIPTKAITDLRSCPTEACGGGED